MIQSIRCWSSEVNNPCPGVLPSAPSSRNYDGGFNSGTVQNSIMRTCACMCEFTRKFKLSFPRTLSCFSACFCIHYPTHPLLPCLTSPSTPYLTLPHLHSLCLVSVLMKKDLRLAVDAAESRKIPLPTGQLALSTYTSLCETGLSHKDFSVVYDHLSKMK